jgi:hypothetical protein
LAEIVNLRRARKEQRRQESERQAAAARSLAGQTKSVRKASALQNERLDQHLEGHRLTGARDERTKEQG